MIQLTILFVELNDRDLISLGQCIDREEAKDQKRCFLYQVHAPTDWSELGGGHIDSDEETDLDVWRATRARLSEAYSGTEIWKRFQHYCRAMSANELHDYD